MNTPDVYRRYAEEGFTAPETARALGVCRQAPEVTARRHGFRFLTPREATLARVRAAAEAGATVRQAAKLAGVTQRYVYRLAAAHPELRFTAANPIRHAIADLSTPQREDYALARRKGFPMDEALRIATGARA